LLLPKLGSFLLSFLSILFSLLFGAFGSCLVTPFELQQIEGKADKEQPEIR
jgi:hypothetical protein